MVSNIFHSLSKNTVVHKLKEVGFQLFLAWYSTWCKASPNSFVQIKWPNVPFFQIMRECLIQISDVYYIRLFVLTIWYQFLHLTNFHSLSPENGSSLCFLYKSFGQSTSASKIYLYLSFFTNLSISSRVKSLIVSHANASSSFWIITRP